MTLKHDVALAGARVVHTENKLRGLRASLGLAPSQHGLLEQEIAAVEQQLCEQKGEYQRLRAEADRHDNALRNAPPEQMRLGGSR